MNHLGLWYLRTFGHYRYDPQRMNPANFGDHLTFARVPFVGVCGSQSRVGYMSGIY